MAMITILLPNGAHGEADESALVKSVKIIDNAHEYTVATEYRFPGSDVVVHRSVHVTIKEGMAAFPALESFG